MRNDYAYDRQSNTFRRVTRTVGNTLATVLRYLVATVAIAVVFYLVFALLVSTDEEKALQRENRLYKKLYPEMEEKERLLEDVVAGLQVKDNDIYERLFYTEAPSTKPVTAADFIALSDSLSDSFFLSYSASKAENLGKMADRVEENFRAVMEICASRRDSLPPLTLPLAGMTYAQTGASVGEKLNPFYKVAVQHNGWDIIAHEGEPVYATADGRVSEVVRSRRGLGNSVTIDHGNGFVTRYTFLNDIVVSRGQAVKRGKKLGNVGTSRNSFAPHLHYEVIQDGTPVDPVDYAFASVTPFQYANMMYLSVSTRQSMD